jgi:L-sorbose 1-phosphate reductase
MELTPLLSFQEKGKKDPRFLKLAEMTGRHNGLWSVEAERFLLENF